MTTPSLPRFDEARQRDTIRNLYAKHNGHRPLRLRLRRATPGDAPSVKRRRYYLYSFDPDTGWSPNATVPCVDLEQGQLFVNGVQIVAPQVTTDHVAWLQHAEGEDGRHYLAGHLHLNSNGVEAHGVVVAGDDHGNAVGHGVLATAIPSVKYQTRITSGRYPASTDPGSLPEDAWETGLPLEIGHKQQIGESVPSPVVKLGDQDVSEQSHWSVDESFTVLNVELNDSECALAPDLYAQASVSFDATALNAPGNGTVRRTCSDPAGVDGTVRFWQASVQTQTATEPSLMAAPLPHPQRQAVTATQLLSTADTPLNINELMTLLPNDVVNEDANSMLMRNMKWAMGQDQDEKDWLAKFFNETPPTIAEPDQRALVEQGLDWYQNKFAMSYLTQSFNSYSGPNEPIHRLDTNQAATLDGFLKTGLAKDKDFNVQHQGIFIDAYVGVQERLQDYINDNTPEYVGWAQGTVVFHRADASQELKVPAGVTVQTASGTTFTTQSIVTMPTGATDSGPVTVVAIEPGLDGVVGAGAITQFGPQKAKGIDSVTNPAATTLEADTGGVKWAKKLYSQLTTGTQFVLMVNRIAAVEGDPKALGPVNNFACLLTALDTSGKIATNYFQSVLSGVVVKLVPQVVHRDSDTILQWLPATMQELFRKLADGELPQETDITQAEAQEIYQEFLKHQADVSAATADLLQSIIASGLIKQSQAAEEQFEETIAARWPKLAKAGRFMLAFGWIGGVASVIVSLTKGDWKKMTDVERSEFVDNCVQLTITGFDAVPLIWQGVKYVTLTIWNKLVTWWNAPPQQVAVESQQVNALGENSPLLPEQSENVNELMEASEATGTLGKGTIFERLFADGVFSGVLKIAGALAAAAMAAFSLWQLIDDVKNHGTVTTIVFDSLMFAANFLSAVCLIVDLFVATSWIPIAGALLAIAGIIIGIIAGFFEKPDNPVDDWMVDHGIPFVKGLGTQTQSVAAARLTSLTA